MMSLLTTLAVAYVLGGLALTLLFFLPMRKFVSTVIKTDGDRLNIVLGESFTKHPTLTSISHLMLVAFPLHYQLVDRLYELHVTQVPA